ncbi:MAG TPA: hypothetical protein VHB97_02630 [Polyangia bacterium]|nr:hypothetical protein [Polyangia bacterium]
MRYLVCVLVLAGGCAVGNYAYSFDLTNPGAHNLQKPGERDTLDDADVRAEILVDATSFQAVLLDLTNKTEVPLQVAWDQISIVGPDRAQNPLRPDAPLGAVEPGAKVTARLVPFSLPAQGAAAKAYDNTDFELVVPMTVRGAPTEKRYLLHARANKL